MANPLKGEVEFEADGKTYIIQYTHDALIQLEDELDQGIVTIVEEIQSWARDAKRIRLKLVRALLWAGLRKHHPEITIEEAGELMSAAGGVGQVLAIAAKGVERSFNPPSEMKGSRPTKENGKANGIGEPSLPSSLQSDTPSENSGILPLPNTN